MPMFKDYLNFILANKTTKMKRLLFILALATTALLCRAENITSPNGNMKLTVEVKNGTLVYQLQLNNQTINGR